jgi:Na+/H+ antiporter NhaA
MLGEAHLAGIGFTMALFLNGPAFPPPDLRTQEADRTIGALIDRLSVRNPSCRAW